MNVKDITEKNLEARNDVLADTVNALLFNGEIRILIIGFENQTKPITACR